MRTRLWFDALVAWANSCAWLSSRYEYDWEPAVSVSHAICAKGAPSATTMRKVLRRGLSIGVVARHGDHWRPWPKVDELARLDQLSVATLDEYAQIAEYIATNMDAQYAPVVDMWAQRATAARAAHLAKSTTAHDPRSLVE